MQLQLGVSQKEAASPLGCPSRRCEKRLTPRGTLLLWGSLASALPAQGYPALRPLHRAARHSHCFGQGCGVLGCCSSRSIGLSSEHHVYGGVLIKVHKRFCSA